MTEVFRAKNVINKTNKVIRKTKSNVDAAIANKDIAVTLIGQAVFTTLDQFIKRNTKLLNWRTEKWILKGKDIVDGVPTKLIAASKKKEYSGPGIVVIKDIESGKLAVTSTVDLATFITEFSYHNLDSGKYGKGAQKMKVVDLYVHECETTSSARNGANKLRTRIRQAGLAA